MQEPARIPAPARASRRTRLVAGLLWAGIVAGVLLAAEARRLMPEAPDNWTYDWRTSLLSERAPAPREDIALVLIGEESLAQYASVSPIDRGLTASLVRAIDAAGAKVIGLDLVYDRETDPAKTAELLAAIQSAQARIVLGALDARTTGVTEAQFAYQDSFLARAARPVGHLIVGRDRRRLGFAGQVVRYIAGPALEGPPLAAFAELIAAFEGTKPAPATSYIAWLRPPEKGGGRVFPEFEIPPHAPGSPDDVILPRGWRAALDGRIVLVGGDFFDRDQHSTPFSVIDGAKTAGVAIHAQIVAQLRDGRAIYTSPLWAQALALFVIASIGSWLATRWRLKSHGFLVWLAGLGVVVLLGGLLFERFSLIIPSASLFFAWLAGVWGGHVRGPALRRLGLH